MAKTEVISKVTQLISAYNKHYKYSKIPQEQISHHLLLFYAVECGLKAEYLKTQGAQSTADFINSFPNNKYGHGHNILEWVKELKLPASIGSFTDNNNPLPLIQLHERLRYGTFSSVKEKDQIIILKNIAVALDGLLK